jgi:hypothetical protein
VPQSSASSGTKASQWDLHQENQQATKKDKETLRHPEDILGSMRRSSILLKIDIVPCSFAVFIIERYEMATEESG